MAKGGVDAAGAFLMKTEFDIEHFQTYVLLDKCMNVGNLAADMIDFVLLVMGAISALGEHLFCDNSRTAKSCAY